MPKSSDDRAGLCVFTFADGRHCTLPESPDDLGLCYYHARKFINEKNKRLAGQQIARLLSSDISTACDLSAVFNSLFSATAQGSIKPKTASTLAYIGQLMLQTQRLAKEEYLDTFSKSWPDIVYDSPAFNFYRPRHDDPDRQQSKARLGRLEDSGSEPYRSAHDNNSEPAPNSKSSADVDDDPDSAQAASGDTPLAAAS